MTICRVTFLFTFFGLKIHETRDFCNQTTMVGSSWCNFVILVYKNRMYRMVKVEKFGSRRAFPLHDARWLNWYLVLSSLA